MNREKYVKAAGSRSENWGCAVFFFDRKHYDLVGGLEHGFYDFPYIGNFIIPTDEVIFFRGVRLKPPTTL